MARIRSAKPEWWTKAKWCALPRDVRFTYKGIWEVMCDDDGRFQADARLVKSSVWPLDDDITVKKIEGWLKIIAGVSVTLENGTKLPALVLYEVDGVRYGWLPTFNEHQKISHATRSKLPNPPGISPETLANTSGRTPEPLRPDVDLDLNGLERTTNGVSAAAVALSVAANKGLAEHPKRPQPIARIMASSGKSHEAADAILAAGVPLAFAESVVYELARTHSADGEVQTLKYFSPGVIRRWQQEQAGSAAKSATAPSILPRRVPGEPDDLTARVARASGHVNTRKAQQDGDLWWRRMRRDAKASGAKTERDVLLYAANHIDEPAELEAAEVANGR